MASTVTVTTLEVARALALSTACAVNGYVPAGALLIVKVYGLLASEPSKLTPVKNCTLVTVPSLSEALATKVNVAGAKKWVPLVGLVKETEGGTLTLATLTFPLCSGWVTEW